MRAFVERPCVFAFISIAAVVTVRALAQSDSVPASASPDQLEASALETPEASATSSAADPEEITIRGQKSLAQYRLELEQAHDKIVEVFNRVNSSNDNDLTCRNERPTGSRMTRHVCRSKAQERSDAAAAKLFLDSLFYSAGQVRGQAGSSPGGQLIPSAQLEGVMNEAAGAGQVDAERIDAELKRLKKENRELFRVVLRYVELQNEYNKAREESTSVAE